MIHEFSHAALYTEDYAYRKILAGVDLTPLYALPKGMLAKEDQLDAYKNIMTPSGEENFAKIAYMNADSFSYATALLAYSASKDSKRREQFEHFVINRPAL